jgi:hypothetical protein
MIPLNPTTSHVTHNIKVSFGSVTFTTSRFQAIKDKRRGKNYSILWHKLYLHMLYHRKVWDLILPWWAANTPH